MDFTFETKFRVSPQIIKPKAVPDLRFQGISILFQLTVKKSESFARPSNSLFQSVLHPILRIIFGVFKPLVASPLFPIQ
uniref:Uncharacterized protein n=1 Tax=Cucumis sativus TaxID=3659 RepID=A0A0A0LB50_CUCSA